MPKLPEARPASIAAAKISRGTPAFRRTMLALFSAGWATFAIVYCVQPLMPVFAQRFDVSAAASSLTVSLTAGGMAVALVVMGILSEALGRKSLMTWSLALSAILTIGLAVAPNFGTLLVLRALTGLAISGLPAVAMAYLSEEMEPTSLGLAMGLYIAGNGLGGMSGRLITAAITDYVSWRAALGTIGLIALGSSFLFWRNLPPSRHFIAQPLHAPSHLRAIGQHLVDKGLPWLFASAFLLMGGFVTLYNYIGFRLSAAPYSLSQSALGVLFSVYLAGIASSALAGNLADRFGRRKMMWLFVGIFLMGVLMTLASSLFLIITALAVATFGFFGAHSIASSWVGRRALTARAQAASLYLFFYYLGSSVAGWLGGVVWTHYGWDGLVAGISLLIGLALLIALRLSLLKPLPIPERRLTSLATGS